MKKIIVWILCSLSFFAMRGQDQLFKTDNSKMLVRILEVGPTEIKYKMYTNLNGPTYVENRDNVSMIIYENGQHEVMTAPSKNPAQKGQVPATDYVYAEPAPAPQRVSRFDSAQYFRHSNSIHLNFLNFMNNEMGFIYQKDLFQSHMSIQIPFAIGADRPGISQTVFFENMANRYTLDRKAFEIGIGVHYYPNFRTAVNYYIGPSFRFLQYEGTQIHHTSGRFFPAHNSLLNRYCFTITNGLVFRTKSRLMATMFGSLGFKNDVVNSKLVDPVTNEEIDPIIDPVGIYFWIGFTLGFAF